MPEGILDTETVLLLCVVAVLVLIPLLTLLVTRLQAFKRELRYLNNEIGRTTGSEQEYYRHKKRRLLLSLLPFVKY